MPRVIYDTAGLGVLFWLAGYLMSLALFFLMSPDQMGWIIFIIMTPVTITVTWYWFCDRALPFWYFIKVAACWTAIALVADYFFIVLLFSAQGYYHASVLAYYAATFVIPVAVGWILQGRVKK